MKNCFLLIKIVFFISLFFLFISLSSCGSDNPKSEEEEEPEDKNTVISEIKNLIESVNYDYIRYYSTDFSHKFIKIKNEYEKTIPQLEYEALLEYKNKTQEAVDALKLKYNDIPQLFINDGESLFSREYTSVTAALFDPSDKSGIIYDKSAQIKIRGNSTSATEKLSFTLKFSSSKSVLDMPEDNKWVLLANPFDKTMMRTAIAYTFSSYLNLPCSPQFRYAELWINNIYRGNYLIVEAADSVFKHATQEYKTNRYLLEKNIIREEAGVKYVTSEGLGLRFEINEPKNLGNEQLDYLQKILNEAQAAILSYNMDIYKKHIDINSFVDYCILYELIKDIDFGEYSTRYFVMNGKIYCGPAWDLDLTMGNVSSDIDEIKYKTYLNLNSGDGSGESASGLWTERDWFTFLLKDENFKSLVHKRYTELSDKIVNLYEDNIFGKNIIDILYDNYKSSFLRNYTETNWKLDILYGPYESRETFETYEEYLESLRNWLKNRHEWLLDNIGK